MKKVTFLKLLIAVFFVIINLSHGAQILKCYQCYTQEETPCPEEDLKMCPWWTMANRCRTRYRRIWDSGESWIIRDCQVMPWCAGHEKFRDFSNTAQDCQPYLIGFWIGQYEHTAYCMGDGCNKHFQYDPNFLYDNRKVPRNETSSLSSKKAEKIDAASN
ncbi:hypothetical protein HDE_09765 [Halotydeus destructor]|nr:hypothetical protein HDE_09765 [Halotydeus destructor]